MPRLLRELKNKPQARTEATKERILDAAKASFAEQGFENTQLDEVAARAGCSRGGIYAHYANKEDVFLALMEHRVYTSFGEACKKMEAEPDTKKRHIIFKSWIMAQFSDRSWGTLTLEYKLYSVRRPELEAREKLLGLYESAFGASAKDFIELLYGNRLSKAARIACERRLAVLGGALSGLVLESRFQPGLLPFKHVEKLAEELVDTLIHI